MPPVSLPVTAGPPGPENSAPDASAFRTQCLPTPWQRRQCRGEAERDQQLPRHAEIPLAEVALFLAASLEAQATDGKRSRKARPMQQ